VENPKQDEHGRSIEHMTSDKKKEAGSTEPRPDDLQAVTLMLERRQVAWLDRIAEEDKTRSRSVVARRAIDGLYDKAAE